MRRTWQDSLPSVSYSGNRRRGRTSLRACQLQIHGNGQFKEDQSKTYNNVFPSLSISTQIGKTQLALNYTSKMQRPSYDDLDGTINYINRLTLGSGNPYLSPVKIHTVELMGAWKQFFVKVAYENRKNATIGTTKPYGEDGEVKLLTMENTPKIQQLQAFLGAQFQIGIWQPSINMGIIKQWFSGEYLGGHKSYGNPLGIVQFQNAIHLPGDIWMNIDMEWNSRGNKDNMKLGYSLMPSMPNFTRLSARNVSPYHSKLTTSSTRVIVT